MGCSGRGIKACENREGKASHQRELEDTHLNMFKVTSFAVIAVLAVAGMLSQFLVFCRTRLTEDLGVVAHAQSLPPNCARTYTVQAGDTCNSISADQGVST